jgi:hypothetical protein
MQETDVSWQYNLKDRFSQALLRKFLIRHFRLSWKEQGWDGPLWYTGGFLHAACPSVFTHKMVAIKLGYTGGFLYAACPSVFTHKMVAIKHKAGLQCRSFCVHSGAFKFGAGAFQWYIIINITLLIGSFLQKQIAWLKQQKIGYLRF